MRLPALGLFVALIAGGCASAATPTAGPPTGSPSRQPDPTPASLAPSGTWHVELATSDLEAAGWPADVTPAGTYVWTFEDARATLDLDADDGSDAHCEAAMVPLDGSSFRLDYDDGDCGGEVDRISWTLEDDGLHLVLISTNAPVDQQHAYLETKPWQPAEPGG